VCNENAGRKILPFNGMLPGDAWLWSKHRDDRELLEKFREFTERKFDKQRGYYGKIGDRTVIKNTSIIKDVWVGSDAYIKGANKLKNLTINSSNEAPTQIGEGCELVNGIIGYGCRIFYGVKAVRFQIASHSQLKYGARLINSYLGNNATISCCEVLNSLIFPAHEQHHNNSFLCASVVMGQSNIAAGVTIGSNHNSRAADGEIVAGRGFWPGLCVSLKHNSKFATYTLIAKGDYPNELNIPLPFSLVSNDEAENKLVIMPAYWFMYNMYALARNAHKYIDRDMRTDKTQLIEYDYLAPDSINEIFIAIALLKKFTAIAVEKNNFKKNEEDLLEAGRLILEDPKTDLKNFQINAYGFENNNRPTQLIKVKEAYSIYKQLIIFYGINQLVNHISIAGISSLESLLGSLPSQPLRLEWQNVGGQLLPNNEVTNLFENIKKSNITSWKEVHLFYRRNSELYEVQKLQHGFAALLEILKITSNEFSSGLFKNLLQQSINTKEWMVQHIYNSRAKDYQNTFRKMLYENDKEMEEVLGDLDDNIFIKEQETALKKFRKQICVIISEFNL
jgi:carbonic anhydrase/acetyltransferase-like protein (isoleucine patch superfamily)